MSMEHDSKGIYEAFRSQLPQSDIRLVDLPADQRELYFKLVQTHVFPHFSKLGQATARRGMPAPIFADIPTFHSIQTIDKGQRESDWLSVSIHTPITPEPLSVGDEIVGNATSHLGISDTVHSIRFSTLENGQVVVENSNTPGSARLLNTPNTLFDEIPSHKLYPAGNPAAWIDKIIQRDMLEKVEEDLGLMVPQPKRISGLPEERDEHGSEMPVIQEAYRIDVINRIREIVETDDRYADIKVTVVNPHPEEVLSSKKAYVQIKGLGFDRLDDFWKTLNQRLQEDTS